MAWVTKPTDARRRAACGWGTVSVSAWLLWPLSMAACVRATSPLPESVPVESATSSRPAYVAIFRLQESGEDGDGVPRTRVDFVMHSPGAASELLPLGSEAGGCVERPPRDGELVRVACWWGPAECHWVARRDPGGVVLLRAEGPRESVPPSSPPSSGWDARARVDLPSGTVVTRLSD